MFIIQARNKVNADSRLNCTCVASVLPANTRKPEHRAIVLSVTGRSTADSALATAGASSAPARASALKRARNWMVSSTAMPMAMQAIRQVVGLSAISSNPSVPQEIAAEIGSANARTQVTNEQLVMRPMLHEKTTTKQTQHE